MRADEVRVGDMLAGGQRVVSISRTAKFVYLQVRVDDGPVRRLRRVPHTIVPTPGNPNPGQHQKGHPWSKGRFIPKKARTDDERH